MEPPTEDAHNAEFQGKCSDTLSSETETGALKSQFLMQEEQAAAAGSQSELHGLRTALLNSQEEIGKLRAQLSMQQEQTAKNRLAAFESGEKSKQFNQELERLQQALVKCSLEKKQESKIFKVTMPGFHLYPAAGLIDGDRSLGELSSGDILQTTLDDDLIRCGQKFWRKVRVLSGNAMGKTGWINTTDACKDPKKAAAAAAKKKI